MLIPVVLCGGAGSRLWPVSRELHPKPFIQLNDGQSLLQKALLRGVHLPGVEHVVTVTNEALLLKTKQAYTEVGSYPIKHSFMLEPSGRNTAAAITLAALHVAALYGEEAVLLILPADHLILDEAAFQEAVMQATQLAQKGQLVTFGMQATTPETGFGYIEADGHRVLQFIEKPSFDKALDYVASGRYLWNSGMFCFTAGALLTEMQSHAPEIVTRVQACLQQSKHLEFQDEHQWYLNATAFEQVPSQSIDIALMEQSQNVGVVPCAVGWCDVGSWRALADLSPPDAHNNRFTGEVLAQDAHGCYIQNPHRLVAAVGIDDLIIIDTPDALLVAHQSRVQDVKDIYNQLKAQNHEAYKLHKTVFRPWGSYTVLEEGLGFKIKRIVVNPGGRLSLQMHHHRSEHWVVVSGSASVTNGDKIMTIHTNESTYIPAKHKHRLENLTQEPVVLIEVQSGAYLGEDDIVRYEDVYGRVLDESAV